MPEERISEPGVNYLYWERAMRNAEREEQASVLAGLVNMKPLCTHCLPLPEAAARIPA